MRHKSRAMKPHADNNPPSTSAGADTQAATPYAPVKTRRAVLITSLLILVLLSLILWAWLKRDTWLSALINHELTPYAIRLTSLQGSDIHWRGGLVLTLSSSTIHIDLPEQAFTPTSPQAMNNAINNSAIANPINYPIDSIINIDSSHPRSDTAIVIRLNELELDLSQARPRVSAANIVIQAPAKLNQAMVTEVMARFQTNTLASQSAPPQPTALLPLPLPIDIKVNQAQLGLGELTLMLDKLEVTDDALTLNLMVKPMANASSNEAAPSTLSLRWQQHKGLALESNLSFASLLAQVNLLIHQGSFPEYLQDNNALSALHPWLWQGDDARLEGVASVMLTGHADLNQWFGTNEPSITGQLQLSELNYRLDSELLITKLAELLPPSLMQPKTQPAYPSTPASTPVSGDVLFSITKFSGQISAQQELASAIDLKSMDLKSINWQTLDWQIEPASVQLLLPRAIDNALALWLQQHMVPKLHQQLPTEWQWLATSLPWLDIAASIAAWQLTWDTPMTGVGMNRVSVDDISLQQLFAADTNADTKSHANTKSHAHTKADANNTAAVMGNTSASPNNIKSEFRLMTKLSQLRWQAPQLSANYQAEASLNHWQIAHSAPLTVKALISPLQMSINGTLGATIASNFAPTPINSTPINSTSINPVPTSPVAINPIAINSVPTSQASASQTQTAINWWHSQAMMALELKINELDILDKRLLTQDKVSGLESTQFSVKGEEFHAQAKWQLNLQSQAAVSLFPNYHRIDLGPVMIEKQLKHQKQGLVPRWRLSLPSSQLILLPAADSGNNANANLNPYPNAKLTHQFELGLVTEQVLWQSYAEIFHPQLLSTTAPRQQHKIVSQHAINHLGLHASIDYHSGARTRLSSQALWQLDALSLSSQQALNINPARNEWQVTGDWQHQSSLKQWQPLLSRASRELINSLQGDLSFTGAFTWGNHTPYQPFTNTFAIELNHINGAIAHVPIDNATIKLPCTLHGALQPLFSANIDCNIALRASAINPFTVIENIDFSGKLTANLGGLDSNQAKAELQGQGQLLGGDVIIPSVVVTNQQQASLYLLLQDLDLTRIMDKQRLQGIHASGRIDGVLPAFYQDGKVSINGGRLAARPPGGEISLQDNEKFQQLASSEPQLAFALDVLKQLNYRELSSSFEMDNHGEAQLNIHLEGSSPSYQRPIVFNYHQSENMLKLIESLQIGNRLEQELQQKINAEPSKELQ